MSLINIEIRSKEYDEVMALFNLDKNNNKVKIPEINGEIGFDSIPSQKGFGLPEIITISLSVLSGVSIKLISAWLTDKLIKTKEKTPTVVINNITVNITNKKDVESQINEILHNSKPEEDITII